MAALLGLTSQILACDGKGSGENRLNYQVVKPQRNNAFFEYDAMQAVYKRQQCNQTENYCKYTEQEDEAQNAESCPKPAVKCAHNVAVFLRFVGDSDEFVKN